jgi:hypothetical protein
MRFRKVRSFLSAYSNDELTGRREEIVREQLARDESLRREEALYGAIRKASAQLPPVKVSADFNARLLDRIARERFAETRTRAYFPKPAWGWWWRRAVPAVAAVAVLTLAAINVIGPSSSGPKMHAETGLDDSYLTVQPGDDRNLVPTRSGEVSLRQLMARVDRADQISSFLTSRQVTGPFDQVMGTGLTAVSGRWQAPFSVSYIRIRPVLRVVPAAAGEEAEKVY